jgi:hypothetical protein
MVSLLVGCADDAARIKALIPAATAMPQEYWDKTANSDTPLKASDIDERPLTTMLLTFGPKARPRTKEAKEEFGGIDGRPMKASSYREEISRRTDGLVTLVHADRITEFTCEVDGDTAKGTVAFEVPELYRGKFEYVARRSRGNWAITETAMPANGIHVVRDQQGKWKELNREP